MTSDWHLDLVLLIDSLRDFKIVYCKSLQNANKWYLWNTVNCFHSFRNSHLIFHTYAYNNTNNDIFFFPSCIWKMLIAWRKSPRNCNKWSDDCEAWANPDCIYVDHQHHKHDSSLYFVCIYISWLFILRKMVLLTQILECSSH